MSRSLLYRLAALMVALTAASAADASAQTVIQAGAPSDTVARVLRPMVISAERLRAVGSGNAFQRAWHMDEDRSRILDLARGNRALERTLREQDATIARLERTLDSVKMVAADRLREITTIDSANVATHRRRLEVAQRILDAERRSGARPLP